MNCVMKSRRCVRKESEEQGEEVYIVNLVARLTVLYRALSRFGRNSADLAEFGRNGRLWQNLAETADCGKLWWRQVESGWRVCKVSRRCPVTPYLLKDSSLSNLSCSTIMPLLPPVCK